MFIRLDIQDFKYLHQLIIWTDIFRSREGFWIHNHMFDLASFYMVVLTVSPKPIEIWQSHAI